MVKEPGVNVLGILFSPRPKGNSAALLEAFLEGARAAGAHTELVFFHSLNVSCCDGCNACRKGADRCIVRDDMQQVYDKLAAADVIAQSSPVYLDHVTAQAKIFLDRCHSLVGPDFKTRLPEGKKGAYFLDWEAGPDMPYGGILDWWQARFEYYFRVETAYVLGVDSTGKSPVSEREDLLSAVREAGERIARGENLLGEDGVKAD